MSADGRKEDGMRVLVTGASGLIGGAVAEALGENPAFALTVTARRPLPAYGESLACDLLDPGCPALQRGFDAVAHCAAAVPGPSLTSAEAAEQNARLDGNVLEACLRRGARLVYISAAAYDHFAPGRKTEASPLSPANPYQAEKIRSEARMLESGAACAAARVTSPYGAAQRNMTVMKRFVLDAVQRGRVTYFGTGTRTQDFVHGSDVARAVERMLLTGATGVFNIGSGEPVSMAELARMTAHAAEEAGCGPVEVFAAGQADPQEAYRAQISIEKAGAALAWRPAASLQTELAAWCRAAMEARL